MSYVDRNLISGEAVLYRTRLHWIVMIMPLLAGLVLAVAGITMLYLAFSGDTGASTAIGAISPAEHSALLWAALSVFILAAIIVLIASWKRSATEMAVTNKRVLVKVGALTHRSIEIMLSKIESVVVDQSLPGRILGYGSIVVRGTGGTPEPFAKIAHPLELRRQVQQQIDQLPRTAISPQPELGE